MKLLLALDTPAIIGICVAVGVVVILTIAIIGWYNSAHNKFVKMINQCDEAWSTIDIYLKKRFDLIPNLVETVKGYAKH